MGSGQANSYYLDEDIISWALVLAADMALLLFKRLRRI
jgi:hypothetical protein